MQTLIGYVRSGQPDLTNRQMALMLLVYLTPGPHTVRGLAHMLGVSKPVITRALNTLGALGYLRRVRDEGDRRNVFVAKTSTGQEFLEGFERNIEQRRRQRRGARAQGTRASSSSTDERFHLTGRRSRSTRASTPIATTSPTSRSPGRCSRPIMPAACCAPARCATAVAARRLGARRESSELVPGEGSRCSNMPAAGPGAMPGRPPRRLCPGRRACRTARVAIP